MPTQRKPSIVFVHGIWADGSSFSTLIPTLQVEGYEVIAAQYGLDTHAGDVAARNISRRRARVVPSTVRAARCSGFSLTMIWVRRVGGVHSRKSSTTVNVWSGKSSPIAAAVSRARGIGLTYKRVRLGAPPAAVVGKREGGAL